VSENERDLQDIVPLIGPPKAAIPILSSRDKRRLSKAIARDTSGYESWMLLRAFLSTRRMPSRDLINTQTICEALRATDILKYSRRLMVSHQTIEAEALFTALRRELESYRSTPTFPSLCRNLVRSLTRWIDSFRHDGTNSLTGLTELSFLDLISFLASSATSTIAEGKRSSSPEKRLSTLMYLSFKVAAHSNNPVTLIKLKDLLEMTNRRLSSSSFESLIESEPVSRLAESVRQRIAECARDLIVKGRVDELNSLIGLSRSLSYENTLKDGILDAWNEERGLLSADTQRFLQRYLDLEFKQRGITLADQGESVQISQMAVALLQLWEAREDSPRVAEAFRMFVTFAERFFNLRLHGKVGSEVDFNPRIHEISVPAISGRVVIRRPWVEWTEDAISKVIMRAAVAPV
jgi:hypothetical protein